MIIDLLSECTSIIKCSYADYINSNVVTDSYTIKKANDMLSWKVTNQSVSGVSFTFILHESKILSEILLELNALTTNSRTITIETSLDYINWYELPYKSDGTYLFIKSVGSSGDYYFNLTQPNIGKDKDINDKQLSYAFKMYNDTTKTTNYLYNNLEFKFLKLSINNLELSSFDTLSFKIFNILVDDGFKDIMLSNNLLEIKSNMFNQPKIFESEEFIPDMFRNYFKMIEEKNNTFSSLLYSNAKINTNPFALTSTAEGIGNDIIEVDTIIY